MSLQIRTILASSAAAMLFLSVRAEAQTITQQPSLDPKLSPGARAHAAVAAMALNEKLRIIFGYSDQAFTDLVTVPDETVSPELKTYVVSHLVKGSAGFVPGVPRLDIPDQTVLAGAMVGALSDGPANEVVVHLNDRVWPASTAAQ